MSLVEVVEGVYSLDGKCDFKNNVHPVIAVHPYFNHLYVMKENPDYMRRFENLVMAHEGPIVTLEEEDNFGYTEQRYRSLCGTRHSRYFVKTRPIDPTPLEISWKKLAGFIGKFRGKPVQVVGGCYWEAPKPAYSGCAGWTAFSLEKLNVPTLIRKKITFA